MEKMIPLAKQSKARQREYHLRKRGSWNRINPVSRFVPVKKNYDRCKMKRKARKYSESEL